MKFESTFSLFYPAKKNKNKQSIKKQSSIDIRKLKKDLYLAASLKREHLVKKIL